VGSGSSTSTDQRDVPHRLLRLQQLAHLLDGVAHVGVGLHRSAVGPRRGGRAWSRARVVEQLPHRPVDALRLVADAPREVLDLVLLQAALAQHVREAHDGRQGVAHLVRDARRESRPTVASRSPAHHLLLRRAAAPTLAVSSSVDAAADSSDSLAPEAGRSCG
jgi:hypothetical protein